MIRQLLAAGVLSFDSRRCAGLPMGIFVVTLVLGQYDAVDAHNMLYDTGEMLLLKH